MRHKYGYDNYTIHLEQQPVGKVHRWIATIDKDHPWWKMNNKPGDTTAMTPTGHGATPGEAIEDLIGPKHGNNPRFLTLDLTDEDPEGRARILHYHFHQGWGLVTVDQGVAYMEQRAPAEYDSVDGGRAADSGARARATEILMKNIKLNDDGTFTGQLVVADHVTANNNCYTEEALRQMAGKFHVDRKPEYGGMGMTDNVRLKDIAFLVEDVSFNDIDRALEAQCKPLLKVAPGEMLVKLLALEKKAPGTHALGMAVMVDDGDMTKDADGVLTVQRCTLERISLLLAKDKA